MTFDDSEDEQDPDGSEYFLSGPFDPHAIDISMEVQNVGYLIDLLTDRHIDMNTEFQRSSDLWPATKMSRLIESLLIRLPIPPFYFAARVLPPNSDSPFQVVDGLQRLSTLRRFVIDDNLRLRGLSFLKDLEGKTFGQLERSQRRAIERAQITLYTIRPGTPREVTHILFERINTGGMLLNHQEIRHALNQGTAANILAKMARNSLFQDMVNIKPGRMQDRELCLRHIAFRIIPLEDYRSNLKRFLDQAMFRMSSMSSVETDSLYNDFERSLKFCREVLGQNAFHRTADSKQVNRALFEVLTVNIAKLSPARSGMLRDRAGDFVDAINRLLGSKTFESSILYSTSNQKQVTYRFTAVAETIEKLLEQET